MPARYVLIGTWLIAFLFPACVPLPQYKSLEDDLKESRSGNERTVNDLESRLNQAEEMEVLLET